VLKRAARSLLEEHHLAGRVNDADMTVILCLNCHRRLTSQQRSLGVELDRGRQRVDIEKAISVLCGLAQFFDMLARWLMMWAERLTAHVERLDADFPGWRTNELGET
jgi:hypothetical protein